MSIYRSVIVLVALSMQAIWLVAATAQPVPAGASCDAAAFAALQAERDKLKKQYDEAVASNETLSERTVSLIQQLRKASAAAQDPEIHRIDVTFYQRWAEHNLRVFQMTLIESTVLLVVVLAVVISGLYFSYIQLRTALTAGTAALAPIAKTSAAVAQPKPGRSVLDSATRLELSASGVKITSSIAGVIILAMSLGFFYLYLKEVYPIKFYGPAQGAGSSSTVPQPDR